MSNIPKFGIRINSKENNIVTEQLEIQGNLLRWEGTIIQISNISLITTSNLSTPRFPLWSLLLALAGIVAIAEESLLLGLFLIVVTSAIGYLWYSDYQYAKSGKFLNLLLNSGHTYSIVFHDKKFLRKVLGVFSSIMIDGSNPAVNYNIDLNNCVIDRSSSIIRHY